MWRRRRRHLGLLTGGTEREKYRGRETDVGIICVKIYDDLILGAWTQRERERERERE